jgi:hypothetical protein
MIEYLVGIGHNERRKKTPRTNNAVPLTLNSTAPHLHLALLLKAVWST